MMAAEVGYQYWVPHWEFLKMKRIMKDAALTYQVTNSAKAVKDELLMLMRQEQFPMIYQIRIACFMKENLNEY